MYAKTSIYIVENEIIYARFIAHALQEYAQMQSFLQLNTKIIQNYTQFFEKPETVPVKDGDIFFIDIHLNTYFTGIDLAQKIRSQKKEVEIVYLTSDADSSALAINQQTFPAGYLVKQPENKEYVKLEILNTMQRIEQNLMQKLNQGNLILFKVGRQNLLLNPGEIYYITSINNVQNKILIKTLNSTHICSERLKVAKQKFESYPSFFVNMKSFIINTHLIQSMNRIDGTVYFKNDVELYVGAKIIDKIKKYLSSTSTEDTQDYRV
jgi:two-component system response regulator AgrA